MSAPHLPTYPLSLLWQNHPHLPPNPVEKELLQGARNPDQGVRSASHPMDPLGEEAVALLVEVAGEYLNPCLGLLMARLKQVYNEQTQIKDQRLMV